MVGLWAPSGVEKNWYEFIKEVQIDLGVETCKEVCKVMKVMEFSTVQMFQASKPVQLLKSKQEWEGLSDDVWEVICFLRSASVPAPKPVMMKRSSQASNLVLRRSPAVQVVGLLKTSVQLRTSKMLRQVLGLRDDVPMPKPAVLLKIFARR